MIRSIFVLMTFMLCSQGANDSVLDKVGAIIHTALPTPAIENAVAKKLQL